MKLRFLTLLVAIGGLSASVLIYASRSGDNRSAANLGATPDDCSSCEMVTAKTEAQSDCCATLATTAVATLATAGCPYDPAQTTLAASVATVETPAAGKADECCDAAAPVLAAH